MSTTATTIYSVLYAAIADALNANTTLGHVDLNTGQLDDPAHAHPIDYGVGAAFVDFEDIEWTERTGRVQNGRAVVIVSTAIQASGDTYATSDQRAATLALLDKVGNVHAAVQYLSGDGFNALVRVSSSRVPPANLRPGLYVIEQRYVCDVREELPEALIEKSDVTLTTTPVGWAVVPPDTGGYVVG